jgi:hypothetical protein
MAEQHGDKLRPAIEPPSMSLRSSRLNQSREFGAWEVLKKLIKQTGSQYHTDALLLRPVPHPPSYGSDAVQHILGGHFLFLGPFTKPN